MINIFSIYRGINNLINIYILYINNNIILIIGLISIIFNLSGNIIGINGFLYILIKYNIKLEIGISIYEMIIVILLINFTFFINIYIINKILVNLGLIVFMIYCFITYLLLLGGISCLMNSISSIISGLKAVVYNRIWFYILLYTNINIMHHISLAILIWWFIIIDNLLEFGLLSIYGYNIIIKFIFIISGFLISLLITNISLLTIFGLFSLISFILCFFGNLFQHIPIFLIDIHWNPEYSVILFHSFLLSLFSIHIIYYYILYNNNI